MNKPGFWESNFYAKPADVCIVGGGIVGASSAIELRKRMPAARIVLLEKGRFAEGASVKNAGFACFGSIGELTADIDHQGEETAFALAAQRYKGMTMLLERCKSADIGYQRLGGFEVFETPGKYEACLERIDYFNSRIEAFSGHSAVYAPSKKNKDAGIDRNFPYCIENRLEGQLNPMKMMGFLYGELHKAGIEILSATTLNGFVETEQAVVLDTERFELKTRRLLVCTNGYALQLLPNLPLEPARAQVLVTGPIENLKLTGTFHFHEGYYYFRNVENRILLGGARHLDRATEKTDVLELNPFLQEELEKFLRDKLGIERKYAIENRWSGIMGMGPGKFPIVQPVGKKVFCAVRMGGMGIALGSFTGMEAADMVAGSFT